MNDTLEKLSDEQIKEKNWNAVKEACNTLDLESFVYQYHGEPFLLLSVSYGEDKDEDKINEYLKEHFSKLLKDKPTYYDELEYLTDYHYGMSDQYMVCSECCEVICYQPSSGRPDAAWDGVCENCVKNNVKDEYLEYLLDLDIRSVLHINRILEEEDLIEFGFEKIELDFTLGLYSELDNTYPKDALEKCRKELPGYEFIFNQGSYNPYTINYEIWKRKIVTEEEN